MKSHLAVSLLVATCSGIRVTARAPSRGGQPTMTDGTLISPLQLGVAAFVGVGFPALIFGASAAIDMKTGGAARASEDPYIKYPTIEDTFPQDAPLSFLDSAASMLQGLPGLGGREEALSPTRGEQSGPLGAMSGLLKSLTGEAEREQVAAAQAAADAAAMEQAQQAAVQQAAAQQRRAAEQAAAAEQEAVAGKAAAAAEAAATAEAAAAAAAAPAAEADVEAAMAEAEALEAAAAVAEAQQRAAEARLVLAKAKANAAGKAQPPK
jgi:hypothetical protein